MNNRFKEDRSGNAWNDEVPLDLTRVAGALGDSAIEQADCQSLNEVLAQIRTDPRYITGIDWGFVRAGHPEGSGRAHIEELTLNLAAIAHLFSEEFRLKLLILIHVHDTFKGSAEPGRPIGDPKSHGKLAADFLREYCPDNELATIVEYHDELYALWRKNERDGRLPNERLDKLISSISNWDLFLTFTIIDTVTTGKNVNPLIWAFDVLKERVQISLEPVSLLKLILADSSKRSVEK